MPHWRQGPGRGEVIVPCMANRQLETKKKAEIESHHVDAARALENINDAATTIAISVTVAAGTMRRTRRR